MQRKIVNLYLTYFVQKRQNSPQLLPVQYHTGTQKRQVKTPSKIEIAEILFVSVLFLLKQSFRKKKFSPLLNFNFLLSHTEYSKGLTVHPGSCVTDPRSRIPSKTLAATVLSLYQWVLASRARPCAARTRLFGLIATPNGTLRAPPAHRSFAAPQK